MVWLPRTHQGSCTPKARSAGQEVCRRRGSCRSSRRGRAVLSSTTACTSPRTRWRSSRARCRSGPSFLASFEARVCVSASACLLCVSASAWLSGKRDQTTFGPASAANSWPSARRSRGACAVWAMSHTRASRNLDFGFEVRGERQARVPVAAPAILSFSMCVLCVFIDLLRSPSLRRDGVDGVRVEDIKRKRQRGSKKK